MMQNFIGKDGFVWFISVVENRADPLGMGRCQLRIFGWHTDNISELPTQDLPWAQPMYPINNSKAFSAPQLGDWIVGFFMDGMSSQAPIMMGVLPGIELMAEEIQKLPDLPETELINGKVIEVNAPKPLYTNDGVTSGNPTISSAARSVVADTVVNSTNESLAHVCDFISVMQKNIQLKEFIKSQAQNIRKAIRAVLRALGFSDATGQASWFANTLKSIAREVDYVNKQVLQPIINFERLAVAYVAKLREIVSWILSLPAKFLAVLQDCLARTLNLIGSVFTDIGAGLSEGFSSGGDGDFSSVIKEAKALVNTASNTVKLATTAAAGAASVVGSATLGILVPTTQAELDAANKEIASYKTNDVFPDQNKNTP